MRYRPSQRLVVVLCLLAVFSVIGFAYRGFDSLVVAVFVVLLGLCLVDFWYLRSVAARLRPQRHAPQRIGRGQDFAVTVDLRNSADAPLSIDVRDGVPPAAVPPLWIESTTVPAGGGAAVTNMFTVPVRGRWQLGPTWVRIRGRLGLIEGQHRYDDTQSLQVYPDSLLSPHELAKDAADEVRLLDQLRDTRMRGAGTEFESLEEFRNGDDPRHIDWRTTARHGRPVVRRYQVERHRDVMLLVDCGRLMGADAMRGTKLDCAVDSALRLVRIALRSGDRCGLGIFAEQVLGYLRPIAGPAALPTFLSSLYDLQPRWRETDFGPMFARLQTRLTKRALVIVLSDVVDAETSGRYSASLATLARRHVVLFAALRTPLLSAIASTRIASMEEGYKKAVAFRVMREREQAIHALRRRGVHVLDVEPSELTAPLINQFIELRQSSLL